MERVMMLGLLMDAVATTNHQTVRRTSKTVSSQRLADITFWTMPLSLCGQLEDWMGVAGLITMPEAEAVSTFEKHRRHMLPFLTVLRHNSGLHLKHRMTASQDAH